MVTISYTKPNWLTSSDYSPPIKSGSFQLAFGPVAVELEDFRGRHLSQYRSRNPALAALRSRPGARRRDGGRPRAGLSRAGARQAASVAGGDRSAGLAVHDPS